MLGTLNMGAFFALIFLAAQLLPTSLASTLMATSPVVMMLLAWALLAERPRGVHAGRRRAGCRRRRHDGAHRRRSPRTAAGWPPRSAAMVMSSVGFVLAKRWSRQVDVLSSTCWQLIAGGLLLVPVAVMVEGAPPALDGAALAGFGYVTVVATALAFAAWFAALRRLPRRHGRADRPAQPGHRGLARYARRRREPDRPAADAAWPWYLSACCSASRRRPDSRPDPSRVAVENVGDPRTRQSSRTLAAFRPWGS